MGEERAGQAERSATEKFTPALAARFVALALANPINIEILKRLRFLDLPDAWLVAGCLFQAVWNVSAGRPVADGVKDYDIFYFDSADPGWEAEDRAISRTRAALADLAIDFDLKNQARVHLWYAQRFGSAYPQLMCAQDGIERFLVAGTCIGMALGSDGAVELYAPFGLDDCFTGRLRPNPILADRYEAFAAKAESYRARWPHLRIDSAPASPPVRRRQIVIAPTL